MSDTLPPFESSFKNRVVMAAPVKVSGYDKVSAFLTSTITIIGTLVIMMFLMWLTLVIKWAPSTVDATVTEMIGDDLPPLGVADDWQPPGVEEFPEVETPQLADALEATTDAVSSVRAQLEMVDGTAMEMGRGTGLGDIRGGGNGRGGRAPISEADRWKIDIAASTQAEYMTILQHFGITLGVVHKLSNLIEYVSDLTSATPSYREGLRKDEKRLFFINRQNRLRIWDQNKAKSAGCTVDQSVICGHFYPPELRARLLALEKAVYEPAGRSLLDVKETFFEIRSSGGGYDYVVKNIVYLK